jgi:1-acyl-sn-glycerol-3-phosphate acyltransferase
MSAQGYGTIGSWLRLILGFLVISTAALVLVIVDLLLLPWRGLRIRAGNLYGKVVGPVVVGLAGARVKVAHRERLDTSAPAIYVSNHASALDIFVAMWVAPVGGCGVAKKEIARIPFFGWAYKLSGHLLLDRQNRENAIAALRSIADVVRKHGLSIWIWPEGTRSRDGRLLPFKKGFVHLAAATGLPIVPVVVHGAHERWPGRTTRLVPGVLEVEVLEPVPTDDWDPDKADEHVEMVRSIFLEHLRPAQLPAPALAS